MKKLSLALALLFFAGLSIYFYTAAKKPETFEVKLKNGTLRFAKTPRDNDVVTVNLERITRNFTTKTIKIYSDDKIVVLLYGRWGSSDNITEDLCFCIDKNPIAIIRARVGKIEYSVGFPNGYDVEDLYKNLAQLYDKYFADAPALMHNKASNKK